MENGDTLPGECYWVKGTARASERAREGEREWESVGIEKEISSEDSVGERNTCEFYVSLDDITPHLFLIYLLFWLFFIGHEFYVL